jgi:hypothetical protein
MLAHKIDILWAPTTTDKPSQWFWDQTTDKPSTLVLRLNQETCVPHLFVNGIDHTWRHPTSRSTGHRVSDLCDHPRSSKLGLLLLPWFSSLPTMPHLSPSQHEISKHDSPNKTKIKVKQLKCLGFEFKLRNWPLVFSISPLISPLITKSTKFEVWIQDPKKHS